MFFAMLGVLFASDVHLPPWPHVHCCINLRKMGNKALFPFECWQWWYCNFFTFEGFEVSSPTVVRLLVRTLLDGGELPDAEDSSDENNERTLHANESRITK